MQALEISVHCKCFPYIFIIYVFDIFSVLFLEMKDTYQLDMQDADQFLNLLHTLSDMGAAMRKVIGHALTSTSLYKELTEGIILIWFE